MSYITIQLPPPDFLLECKISAIRGRFPLIFAFQMLKVRHISTSGLFDLLTYKVCHMLIRMVIISTKFEVDITVHCLVILFLLLIRYMTLNSCHALHVT